MHHHAHSFGWQHKTCNSIGNLISNDASLSSDNTLQLRKRTTTDAADVYLHSWRFACACHGPPLCSCTQPSGTRPSPLNHFLWCCLHAIGCSKTPISLGHGLRQPLAMDSLILAHAMPWIHSSLHTQCHGFTHPCTRNAMDSLILAHTMPWIPSSLHTQCHGFPHPCTRNAMDSLILAHAMPWIHSSLHTQCHGFPHPCTRNAMDSLILAHTMPWIPSSLHTQCYGFPHPCTRNVMDSLILAHTMPGYAPVHLACRPSLLPPA